MIHQDRDRAGSFGDDASQYDRARPSYPSRLVDDLLATETKRLLDVGCGTGLASRLFTARGCEVLGVEQDERMAEVARAHGLRVDVARFETWQPPPEPFDLVISAQAWHWIDPAVGPAKAASVLRQSGRFAAFWNSYHLDPEMQRVMRPVYARWAPHLWEASVVLGTIGADEAEAARRGDIKALEACGLFGTVERHEYRWETAYTLDEWLDQLPTHSGHRTLEPDTLAKVLDAVRAALATSGESVHVRYRTNLISAAVSLMTSA